MDLPLLLKLELHHSFEKKQTNVEVLIFHSSSSSGVGNSSELAVKVFSRISTGGWSVTSYQLPVTIYQLPVTSYQLPCFPYDHDGTSQGNITLISTCNEFQQKQCISDIFQPVMSEEAGICVAAWTSRLMWRKHCLLHMTKEYSTVYVNTLCYKNNAYQKQNGIFRIRSKGINH